MILLCHQYPDPDKSMTHSINLSLIFKISSDKTLPLNYRNNYKTMIKENVLDLGIAGWMADFGEYTPLEARTRCSSILL